MLSKKPCTALLPLNVMQPNDSYSQRREVFKDIWETAMGFDEGGSDDKPKLIKTLRLEESINNTVDVGKKKKQRVKNLRIVCNKLLDFCDRQEEEDLFFRQLTLNPKPLKKLRKLKRKKRKNSKRSRSPVPSDVYAPPSDDSPNPTSHNRVPFDLADLIGDGSSPRRHRRRRLKKIKRRKKPS